MFGLSRPTFPSSAHAMAPEPQLMSNSLSRVHCAAKNNNNEGGKKGKMKKNIAASSCENVS